jgi:phosphoglycerate dehydrogenase-like enzyme
MQIAILDDYQHIALTMADWSPLRDRAPITVFQDHLADEGALVARLQPFEIVCVMRERTPLTRSILGRLPKLRLIASTGLQNASIDVGAASELGVDVLHTGYHTSPTVELTWAREASPTKALRSATVVGNSTSVTTLPGKRSACLGWAISAALWHVLERPSI